MAGETVLVIEDDSTMLRVLRDNYAFQGFKVLTASDGEEGVRTALEKRPDLIILDIMLPKANGYEVCRLVREQGLEVPIIMLTAKGQESDIVLGLNLGADDYVTKPFSIKELLARSHAFLRRRQWTEQQMYRFGQFELDLGSHRLLSRGREVALAPKEFAVLAHLVRNRGRAITRDEILRTIWGRDVFVTSRSVDRCITTLRKKIEKNPHRPQFILTIREVGYRFMVPD